MITPVDDKLVAGLLEDIAAGIRDIQELEVKIMQLVMGHFEGRRGLECNYLPLVSCARVIGSIISVAPPEYRPLMCSALFRGITSSDPELDSGYLSSQAVKAAPPIDHGATKH